MSIRNLGTALEINADLEKFIKNMQISVEIKTAKHKEQEMMIAC